jgi:glycine cleavage system H protein
MDGYTYTNIFETKGIEYIIIIGFLILIIPFWLLINKKVPVGAQLKNALGILTESILRVPAGILFSRNHTWVHMRKSGVAETGIDDFLLHITGEVSFRNLHTKGTSITKGDIMADLDHNGKTLHICSPISGIIRETNSSIAGSSSAANSDPYGAGWIYRIAPSDWAGETRALRMAGDAVEWSGMELRRFRDFMAHMAVKNSPELSMVLLQDGGELCDKPLADLPGEVWGEFQKSFLELSD